MKKLLALVLALSLVATLSLAAFAADYGSDDSDDGSSGSSGSTNTPNTPSIGSGTTTDAPATVVAPSVVENAIQSGASTVNVTSNAVVTQSVVQSIAQATAPVSFAAPTHTITINPATITAVQDINLSMTPSAPATTTTFSTFFEGTFAAVSMGQKGDFGATVELSIPATTITGVSLEAPIYCYSYNPATNTFISFGAVALVDGKLNLSITRGYDLVFTNAATLTVKA